jgi:hypothetical protein
MGMYPLEDLIRKWRLGELTIEQAVGQILLWLQWLERRERGEERAERNHGGKGQGKQG